MFHIINNKVCLDISFPKAYQISQNLQVPQLGLPSLPATDLTDSFRSYNGDLLDEDHTARRLMASSEVAALRRVKSRAEKNELVRKPVSFWSQQLMAQLASPAPSYARVVLGAYTHAPLRTERHLHIGRHAHNAVSKPCLPSTSRVFQTPPPHAQPLSTPTHLAPVARVAVVCLYPRLVPASIGTFNHPALLDDFLAYIRLRSARSLS